MSMPKLLPAIASVALALVFPCSASADLTGTVTLSTNSTFNLNAGATPGCAGDIVWAGSYYLGPSGAATMFVVPGAGGSAEFASLTLADLQSLTYAQTGISNPVVNDVFAVKTNAGSYAKVIVTAIAGTSITVQYLTYGATAGAPVILNVFNNYGYGGISDGSLFVIRGCGLATPGSQAVLQDATKGLPATLSGASVSVAVNGVTTNPALYYAMPTQIAAVLPSNTPAGTGAVSVAFNGLTGTSPPVVVSPTAFGFASFYETGSGPGLANDVNYQLITPTHPAVPGQAVTFWGSGLGPSSQDSDAAYTNSPHAITVPGFPLQVLIGGIPAQILYQGRSGYPGLDQINVMVPLGVETGCAVSVVAVNGNYQIFSNFVTLPIAAGGACNDPLIGIGAQQLASLSAKDTVTVGVMALQQGEGVFFGGAALADFFTLPGAQLGAWLAGQYQSFSIGLSPQVSQGSCVAATGAASSPASPSASSVAIGSLTFTPSVPSGTRILPILPSSTASNSIVALSVSISARMSPDFTVSPSFTSHLASLPSSIVGDSAGIKICVMPARPYRVLPARARGFRWQIRRRC